jgi:hypothetical protein
MGFGQRHASAALPPGKRIGTHCIGAWVDPRAGLEGPGKFASTGIWSPDRTARSESLFRSTVDRRFWENSCTAGSVVCCDVWSEYLNFSCSKFVGQRFGLYIFIWCISVKWTAGSVSWVTLIEELQMAVSRCDWICLLSKFGCFLYWYWYWYWYIC